MTTTKTPQLRVERKDQDPSSGIVGPVMLTPDIGEDYWSYRVIVGEHQAVVGFPKFGMIGVGFAVEDGEGGSWNTNLPHATSPERLYDHIECNKGDTHITKATCIKAIRLIDAAVREDQACGCRFCKGDPDE